MDRGAFTIPGPHSIEARITKSLSGSEHYPALDAARPAQPAAAAGTRVPAQVGVLKAGLPPSWTWPWREAGEVLAPRSISLARPVQLAVTHPDSHRARGGETAL
jgi:hypothetical protein